MDARVDRNLGIAGEPDRWVHSACGLCSNGCGLDIAVQGGRIVGVRGDARNPVNRGRLGPKGENVWRANTHPDRGTVPLLRGERATWDEALGTLVRELQRGLARGRQSIACYNSGQLLLEEYYALGKMWRGGLQSPHLDANTRLCTATSEWSLVANFGVDGPPGSYEDIDQAQLLVLFGHNVAETQTVLWERMLAAKRRNQGRIIVVDPRRTPTVRQGADLHLQLRGGTNVALMNGLLHLLLRDGHVDRGFVQRHTVGFEQLEQSVQAYTPERVASICDIDQEQLEQAADWIGSTERVVSTVLQGFYQSVDATGASSLVNSMHLLLGKIGKPGCAPLQMAGQPSAMSNREVGADGSYPGYRNPHNLKHMRELCLLWNIDPAGYHAEMPVDIGTTIDHMERGDIDVFWVVGTNPLVSLPDQAKTRRALEKAFVIVQDPFVDADTVAAAVLYLPAAMWGEKTGCMTNAERSVNLLLKAVDPPGEARSDFDIFVDVARRLDLRDKDGKPLLDFREPRDAFEEWRKVSKGRPCDYSGMTYDLILEMGSVRWPCNREHPRGAARLYEDLRFWTGVDEVESYGKDFKTGNAFTREQYEEMDPRGRAMLKPCAYQPPASMPDAEHPFLLSTGRVVYHWHTRTKTGKVPALDAPAPHGYVEVHPDDARRWGVELGDIVELRNERGAWRGPAMVADTVRPGELFLPFHYAGDAGDEANLLTTYSRDPVSQQPQFKQAKVRLAKVRSARPEAWLVRRRDELLAGGPPYAARDVGGTVMEVRA